MVVMHLIRKKVDSLDVEGSEREILPGAELFAVDISGRQADNAHKGDELAYVCIS